MSIALVVTRGFGNGTFSGSIADVVTRGYTIGEAVDTTDSFFASIGVIDDNDMASIGRIMLIGAASAGLITDRYASESLIDDEDSASIGRINPNGSASKGDI